MTKLNIKIPRLCNFYNQRRSIFVQTLFQLKDFYRAIQYMLISTSLFGLMNALVKFFVDYPTFELVFFRSAVSLVIGFFYLKTYKTPIWGNQKWLLLLRACLGTTSMVLFFVSVHYISLGSAVTLRYTAPLFAAFLAVIFLRETIKPIQWFFFCITFLGVVLVKGYDPTVSLFGFSIALLSSFFSACVYIVLNKIGHGDRPVVVVFYFMLIATIVGAIGMCFTEWRSPDLWHWPGLLLLGTFGFLAQLFMTKAFRTYEANMVAPFKYVEVFFTLGFGVFIFHEQYQVLSLLGIFFIIFGLILNIRFKAKWQKKVS